MDILCAIEDKKRKHHKQCSFLPEAHGLSPRGVDRRNARIAAGTEMMPIQGGLHSCCRCNMEMKQHCELAEKPNTTNPRYLR